MKLKFFFLSFFAFLLVSCGEKNMEDMIDGYPVKEEGGQRWGFLDNNGKIIAADWAEYRPSASFNGIFSVREEDYISLFKLSDKPSPIQNCEKLKDAGYFNDEVIPVTRPGERISLVNEKGETVAVLNPINNKEITSCLSYFSGGLLIIEDEEGQRGAVNNKGETIIAPEYEGIVIFKNGRSVAQKRIDGQSRRYIIDDKGKEIKEINKNYYLPNPYYQDGYLLVKTDDSRFGFFDINGEFYILPQYIRSVGDYNSKFFTYKDEDGQWGVMKMTKDNPEPFISPIYNSITLLPHKRFLVYIDERYHILDRKGEIKTSFPSYFEKIIPINGKKFDFIAREGKYYVLLNDNGEKINNKEYYEIDLGFYENKEVYSDYFNVDAFVNDITNPLTNNGMFNYYIDEPVTRLGLSGSPSVYNYTYRFYNENLNIKGYRYDIHFSGSTNKSIAVEQYHEYNFWGEWQSVFNPEAKVDNLSLEACTNENYWDIIKPKLYESLKSKGYSLEKENGVNEAIFINGDLSIIINGGRCINLILGKKGYLNTYSEMEMDTVVYIEPLVEEEFPAEAPAN